MEYLLFLQHIREACPSFVNYFFVFFSEVSVSVVVLIPCLVYWCFDKKIGQFMLLNYSGAYFVNQIVKNSACVYRPWIRDARLYLAPEAIKSATGYSFPSGHTVLATSVFESVAIWQKKRKWLCAICGLFIFLVAFARNWLGAHTQYDVIAAIVETSLVIILNIFLIRYIDSKADVKLFKRKTNFTADYLFVCAGLLFVVLFMNFLQFKKYPLDYDLDGNLLADPYKMLTDCYTGAGLLTGFILGWILERKLVNFQVEASKRVKVIRGLIGAALVGLLYLLILPGVLYCLEDHLKHFIKYFILIFFGTFCYPLMFTKIELKISKIDNTCNK